MPFDPIRTDEKTTRPPERRRDMDTLMILGCSGFGLAAGIVLLLAVWPHFLITDTYRLASLAKASAMGLLPAWIFGAAVSRRLGFPGACGFVGGALATGVFLYIRMGQVLLTRYGDESMQPDYPSEWGWLLPLVFVLGSVAIAFLALPREELPDA